jgi:hypothetical protein
MPGSGSLTREDKNRDSPFRHRPPLDNRHPAGILLRPSRNPGISRALQHGYLLRGSTSLIVVPANAGIQAFSNIDIQATRLSYRRPGECRDPGILKHGYPGPLDYLPSVPANAGIQAFSNIDIQATRLSYRRPGEGRDSGILTKARRPDLSLSRFRLSPE